MSNPPPPIDDEYNEPNFEEEYTDPGMEDSGSTAGEHQPEVNKSLSAVASAPSKNIIILIIIILISMGLVYMLFFKEEENQSPQNQQGNPQDQSKQIQLPGPKAPDPDILIDAIEPPAPDLDIVQVSPDIILPDLPPLVPPKPPEPPAPPSNQIPGQQQSDNEALRFIIGDEELQPDDPTAIAPPPTNAPHLQGGGQGGKQFNAKAVNSLVIGSGGGAEGGGFGGGSPSGVPSIPGLTGTAPVDANNRINVNKLNVTDAETAVATTIRNMNLTIAQGKLMEATLETAINTDLPGLVRAVISRNVYAEQGGYVLIPRGSRLIGNYESSIARGQSRVFIIWNRVIRPDGVDVAIQSPGTDRLGRTGVEGFVDNKYFEIFSNSILISTITTSAALLADQFSDTDGISETENTDGSSRTTGSVSDIAVSEAITNLGDVGSDLAEQLLDSNPTITIDQGTRVNIFVNRDLVFPEEAAKRYLID